MIGCIGTVLVTFTFANIFCFGNEALPCYSMSSRNKAKYWRETSFLQISLKLLREFSLKRFIVVAPHDTLRHLFGHLINEEGDNFFWSTVQCTSWKKILRVSQFNQNLEGRKRIFPESAISRITVLLICSDEMKYEILERALNLGHMKNSLWLLNAFEDNNLLQNLNIPLYSKVLEITNKNVIQYIWKQANDLPLQKKEIARFQFAIYNPSLFHTCNSSESLLTIMQLNPLFEQRKNLTGVHFIVATISNPRAHFILFDKKTGKRRLSGYFGDVWELLRKEMNFTYSIITRQDNNFGSLSPDNKSWTGLVGDVLNGDADVIVAQLSRTYLRSQVVEYSTILIKFSYRIFALPPNSKSLLWTVYTSPFSFSLWIMTVCTVILLSIVFYLSSMLISVKNKTHRIDWKRDSLIIQIAALCQQGWNDTPDTFLERWIIWIAYVLGVVLFASYSGTLVSFFAIMDNKLPFNSLQQLEQLKGYKLGILKGSVLEELFRTAQFSRAWNTLISPYQDTLATNYSAMRYLALHDHQYAYVGSYEVQKMDYVGSCVLASAKQHLAYNDGAFAFPKYSPYVQLFNFYINRLKESGILTKLKSKYFPKAFKCPNEPFQVLGISQVFTAFLILIVGLLLALVLLFCEYLLYWKKLANYKSNY